LKPVPIGATGELCLGGDGLAPGYLNRPELTAGRFGNAREMYRTGDLARWLPDGEIEFLGRIDHQVKIRGFRIELGEIETQVRRHPHIRETVVTANGPAGADRYLCAYYVPAEGDYIPAEGGYVPAEGEIDISMFRDFLSNRLPDYMIPSYFIPLEKIPLTPNGKIDRNALPIPHLQPAGHYTPPVDELERTLVTLWAGVLDLDHETIGTDADFFQLGGHSLKATILIARIHKELDVKIPLAEMFRTPTIKKLAQFIKGSVKETFVSIQPLEKRDYYGLSSAQKRMYIQQHMKKDNTNNNMPRTIYLAEEPDTVKLEKTFMQLIGRHESLRTSFQVVNGEPVQRVRDASEIGFEIETLTEDPAKPVWRPVNQSGERFLRPFDLSRSPLLRAGLLKMPGKPPMLLVDMHHIISDGVSHGVLKQDFTALLEDRTLAPLKLQYKDYAQWQINEKEKTGKQETFWFKQLEGEIPLLDLPIDYPRPPIQTFDGSFLNFLLTPAHTAALEAMAKKEGATLYMILLAVFNVLLSKLSNQEEIIVGTPVAGRRHTELEAIIGMFVNTLALKNNPGSQRSFKGFLNEVKTRTLASFENQEYQLQDLVENLPLNREANRTPLFEVMFGLQNFADDPSTPDSETPESSPGTDHADRSTSSQQELIREPQGDMTVVSKFGMVLMASRKPEGLSFSWTYCKALFKPSTIRRFALYFMEIVTEVVKDPGQTLMDIEMIPDEEKQDLLVNFNSPEPLEPPAKTLPQLFLEQADQAPDRVALVEEGSVAVTYNQLKQRSLQIARHLMEKGVGPDTVAAIMVDRSIETIAGIFGILNAGGAYLPIDPGYPEERIDYLLKDSNAVFCIPDGWETGKDNNQLLMKNSAPSAVKSKSSNLAYIIYTSGSTGSPRGVAVEHSGIVNIIMGLNQAVYLNYAAPLRTVLLAPFVFDASVLHLFGPLLTGHSLYIIPEEIRTDGIALLDFTQRHRPDIFEGSPTHLAMMSEAMTIRPPLHHFRHIIVGGEQLTRDVVERFRALLGNNTPAISNMYGPTECSVAATAYTIPAGASRIDAGNAVPIGSPMPNYRCYILDRHNKTQPIGVTGELCITGAGVARGYLNNPERTKEKFELRTSNFELFYRTGDLARWLPDGNIEFSGRIDHQVKIRGYRIELGEIESLLLPHPQVKEGVVLAAEDEMGGKYLCAYLVLNESGKSAGMPVSAGFRDYLLRSLPGYMVPSAFVFIGKIPLTANGKLDRKALPEAVIEELDGAVVKEDRTLDWIESTLMELWSEVLGIKKDKITVASDFFQLGGHS
ncbi:MAG: amino acid adenylation domain-containing protein, partial [bacterium]|nr:amino acid adenylation domain-containing protein [bacterium]